MGNTPENTKEKPADKIKRELAEKQEAAKAEIEKQETEAAEIEKAKLSQVHIEEAKEQKEPSPGIDDLLKNVEGKPDEDLGNGRGLHKTRHELDAHFGDQMGAAKSAIDMANRPDKVANTHTNAPHGVGGVPVETEAMRKMHVMAADMRPSTPNDHILFGLGDVKFTVGDLRELTGHIR